MEKREERQILAGRAVHKLLESSTRKELSELERDGLIQRFEFTFEIVWKCAKEYLLQEDGIDAASPKKVIRSCREVGIFSDAEAVCALKMADDRNLTTHTYDEKMALEMVERIKTYAVLLDKWYKRITI